MALGGAVAALAITASVAAQAAGGPYALTAVAFTGGGGTASGGAYELTSAIGQPFAGDLSSGRYQLGSGILQALDELFRVFFAGLARDGVLR